MISSRAAIAGLEWPSASSWSTSRSRAVSARSGPSPRSLASSREMTCGSSAVPPAATVRSVETNSVDVGDAVLEQVAEPARGARRARARRRRSRRAGRGRRSRSRGGARGSPAPPAGPRRCASAASGCRRSRCRACSASTAAQQARRPRRAWAATSSPASSQQRDDPAADEQVVVRDHDPHGSSARDGRAGARAGWSTSRRPSSASTRSASPRRPAAARLVGAADAVVGDLDAQRRRPRRTRIAAVVAPGVLGDVGQRLAGDEVGGELDRLAAAARRSSQTTSSGPARAWRASRAPAARPCSSTAGWMPRASSRSSASELGQLVARGGDELLGRGGSSRTRFWSSRSCSAIPTRRCCAPSCRLRSSRRRSASPAATIRSRDALSSASRASDSACSRVVLDRDRGRRADRLDQLGVVVERARRRRARRPRGRRARRRDRALAAARQRDRARRRRRRRLPPASR